MAVFLCFQVKCVSEVLNFQCIAGYSCPGWEVEAGEVTEGFTDDPRRSEGKYNYMPPFPFNATVASTSKMLVCMVCFFSGKCKSLS